MTESNADTTMQLGNNGEQQRSRQNLLRRTRYAQMSLERKTLLLMQQQARRVEAAKIQLLQESSDSYGASEMNTHCSHPNIAPTSRCSVPTYQGHACTFTETRASAEVGLTTNIRGTTEAISRVNVISPTALLANELMKNNGDTPTQFVNSTEQQRSSRNLLRRTRYAEMSTERKNLMFAQQQARRDEAKKIRLSQQPNDTYGAFEVNSQCSHPNITPTSGCSLTTYQGLVYYLQVFCLGFFISPDV